MDRRSVRRIFACILAGTALVGGALALKSGDSVASLSYVEGEFWDSAVKQGKDVANAMLQESCDSVQKELEALHNASMGDGAEQSGSYSGSFSGSTFARGDAVTLESGAGVLVLEGRVIVDHDGAVIDVTEGQEVASSTALIVGHRYLVAEETTARFTAGSGLARMGLEGRYVLEEGPGTAAPFVDVADIDWYAQAVDYVYGNGLLSGVGDDQFAPSLSMSRAMMVTVFYRLAGSPEEQMNAAAAAFHDVKEESWYAPYVRWAAEQGIASGTGDGAFSPEAQITRQQVAVMLRGFASRRLGLTLEGQADLSTYSDSGDVAVWAEEAMSWAIANGIMAGSDGQLLPEQSATRAQVAVMIRSFSEKFL